ncbi:MAG: chemotaxis protein CheW [Labilithrix sp.]
MSALTPEEQAILFQRTAALSKLDRVERAQGLEPAIFFRVGRDRCCALARSVRAAVKLDGLSAIPHGGRSLAGVIVRGGNVIPVFHLAAVLSDRIARLPETAHALLVGSGSDEVALAVDQIDGFGEIDRSAFSPPPDELRSAWITGATSRGESFVDIDALHEGPLLWVDAGPNRTATR